MTSLKQLLKWGQLHLKETCETASLDAEILLCHVAQVPRIYLYSHPDMEVEQETISIYKQSIETRKTGYPIAYLTGKQSFWTLDLDVNEHTLIPRPETELLVELSLNFLKTVEQPTILDLGTGSGAIALAIASERPDALVIAVDLSLDALTVAKGNQLRYELNHVNFVCGNWLDAILPGYHFDLIVSNPPYIAEIDPHLDTGIRYEPHQALISGPKGLDAVFEIITKSKSYLKPGSWLLIEHGYDQKDPIINQLNTLDYDHVRCWQDHAGIGRVSGGQQR